MALLNKLVSLLPKAEVRLVQKQTQIAGQIYDLLTKRNWRQKDLANATGLKESYVSRVLSGDANLTLESIAKIETAFDEDVVVVPLYYIPARITAVSERPAARSTAKMFVHNVQTNVIPATEEAARKVAEASQNDWYNAQAA